MRLRFWGTRGSLPVSLNAPAMLEKMAQGLHAAQGRSFASLDEARAFAATLPFAVAQTYGGQSSCVELDVGLAKQYLLCDAGSGLRAFSQQLLAREGVGGRNTFHIFLSHLHWDHIMGLPFFTPAYIPGNTVHFYGGHADIAAALARQQDEPSFPVPFSALGGSFHFHTLDVGQTHTVAGVQVRLLAQLHGGDSYGYRFEHGGKVAVYATDSEHKLEDPAVTEAVVAFFQGADAVVFDSMYSLADTLSLKADWGHSSNVVGVELCQLAAAKRLVLFHHEPVFGDARIAQMEAESQRLEAITRGPRAPLEVLAAYDGLDLAL